MPRKRSDQCCENCDAWMREQGSSGLCRAHPAQPVFLGFGQRGGILRDPTAPQQGEPIMTSYFPTMAAHGWCREWADKELVDQPRH